MSGGRPDESAQRGAAVLTKRNTMTAKDRLIGIVWLAMLVAAAGTLFGALAVPAEHHVEAAEHHEAEAAHPEAAAATLGAGDATGALVVSLAGIGIVPLALRSARRRNEFARAAAQPDRDLSEALPPRRRAHLSGRGHDSLSLASPPPPR
jgi:hypothetical protein